MGFFIWHNLLITMNELQFNEAYNINTSTNDLTTVIAYR